MGLQCKICLQQNPTNKDGRWKMQAVFGFRENCWGEKRLRGGRGHASNTVYKKGTATHFCVVIFSLGLMWMSQTILLSLKLWHVRSNRNRMVRVADFKSLAAHRFGFEPHTAINSYVRQLSSYPTLVVLSRYPTVDEKLSRAMPGVFLHQLKSWQ